MDINGKQAVKGSGPSVVTLVEDATTGGQEGTHKKWAITFPNGIRIQSDTVLISANSTTEFALPVPYTEAHYLVVVSCAHSIGSSTEEHSNNGRPADAGNNLTHAQLQNTGDANRVFTYLSIGKDAV